MKTLFTAVLVVAVASLASAKAVNHVDVTGGELLPDYVCHQEGVHSDPTVCDCYIVCTADLKAYRMYCEKKDGVQLFYKQSYTLSVGGDICATPSIAACPLNPTTPKPDLPLPDCGDVREGDDCNPMTDCNQCGYCDEYLYCKASSETEGTWTRNGCAIRGDPNLVHRKDKLFWNQNSTVHGGICSPWDNLPSDSQEEYLNDPLCKPPCEFKEDDVCGQVYHYRDPDIKKDIWEKVDWERLACPAKSAWDQETKTCTFCKDEEDPSCNCA